MPRRPNIPCKHPGCAALIPHGQMYCENISLYTQRTEPMQQSVVMVLSGSVREGSS